MKLVQEKLQEENHEEGCGKRFFHFLPMVLGLCYGILGRGAVLKQWWLEAIIATTIILTMHVTFRSWLFVGCSQEIEEIEVTPSARSTCIFIGTVTAGFIYAFALLAILVKWFLA